MKQLVSIPLIFLFIGSVLGVFLRWQFISPTPGANYSYVLHGHSHVMFLGWVLNAIFIGFIRNHISQSQQGFFKILFLALQVLVIGMLISFPLQGYGFFSILFSTLHTLLSAVFVVRFFTQTTATSLISTWYAKVSLVFFCISAAGPFLLGYLMAVGLGQSHWYYFAIYFYLHFQYNGFFLFGVFSLFFHFLKDREIPFDAIKAKQFGIILTVSCVPAYLLSVLWAKPDFIIYILGSGAAVVQLYALIKLMALTKGIRLDLKAKVSKISFYLLHIVLLGFILKLLLQLSSAFPVVATLAYQMRPLVIAYLHLVLVGVVSLFLLVWYRESLFPGSVRGWAIGLFFFFYLGMEISLILSPWWRVVLGADFFTSSECLLFFSAGLSGTCFLFVIGAARVRRQASKVYDHQD